MVRNQGEKGSVLLPPGKPGYSVTQLEPLVKPNVVGAQPRREVQVTDL